jgi:acyl dehydratase
MTALFVGQTLPPREAPASDRLDYTRMALLLRDPNPIHLDRVYARERGFRDAVQQGPIQAARAMQALAGWLDRDWRVRRVSLRFVSNVFPGDVLTTSGRVVSSSDDEVEIEFEQVNQAGTATIRGRAKVGPGVRFQPGSR